MHFRGVFGCVPGCFHVSRGCYTFVKAFFMFMSLRLSLAGVGFKVVVGSVCFGCNVIESCAIHHKPWRYNETYCRSWHGLFSLRP